MVSFAEVADCLPGFLDESGSDAAGQKIEEEAFGSPHGFHGTAKHPKGKHVEEQVPHAAVHEQVGDKLVEVEVGRHEKVQSQYGIQINASLHGHNFGQI